MEQIKLKDINLSSLERLSQQGTKSTVYRDGKKCIKILDKFYENEKEALFRKFLDMDGIEVENVLLPHELIVSDGKLQGYTMDFFDRSISLSDRFMFRYVDCKKLFDYVYKASKILRDIHDNGIIFQDLSFENILVDVNGNVNLIARSNCDLHAGMMVKEACKLANGNGGGSEKFAQGGGKDASSVNEIFKIVREKLEG